MTTGWRNRFSIQTTILLFIRTLTSPYDIYRPESENYGQIEILQKNGELAELSAVPYRSIPCWQPPWDNRFIFPKEMLDQNSIFASITQQFLHLIENDHFTPK